MAATLEDWQSNPLNQNGPEWDIVTVGSSPLPIIDAIFHSLSGKKVIVLEARGVVGGAWAGDTVCGIDGVDIGSHDHCISAVNAEFLNKFFGVACIEVGQGRYLPEGGCAKMSERLVQIAQNSGVVVKTNCKIDKVALADQGVLLDCTDAISGLSFPIAAGKVIKPTYVAFDIFRGSQKISNPIQFPTKQHLYFIVDDCFCSEKYFVGNNIDLNGVRRISNLTLFTRLKGATQRMFVAELEKEVPAAQASKRCQQIVSELQKESCLSPGAQILECEIRQFSYSSVIFNLIGSEERGKFVRLDTTFLENITAHRGRFIALGDVGLERLQKCFPDAFVDLQDPAYPAAVSGC